MQVRSFVASLDLPGAVSKHAPLVPSFLATSATAGGQLPGVRLSVSPTQPVDPSVKKELDVLNEQLAVSLSAFYDQAKDTAGGQLPGVRVFMSSVVALNLFVGVYSYFVLCCVWISMWVEWRFSLMNE